MANDNETVAKIVREMRGEVEWKRGKVLLSNVATEFADRFEAAHEREIAAKDGERKGLLKANESLANDNTRLRGELAAKDAEIAELRDALKDAIELFCDTCTDREEDSGKCKRKDGVCPTVARWRKALEGAKDED